MFAKKRPTWRKRDSDPTWLKSNLTWPKKDHFYECLLALAGLYLKKGRALVVRDHHRRRWTIVARRGVGWGRVWAGQVGLEGRVLGGGSGSWWVARAEWRGKRDLAVRWYNRDMDQSGEDSSE